MIRAYNFSRELEAQLRHLDEQHASAKWHREDHSAKRKPDDGWLSKCSKKLHACPPFCKYSQVLVTMRFAIKFGCTQVNWS